MIPWRSVALSAAFALLAGTTSRVRAAESLPARVEFPTMKTSIYVGSVTLVTSAFTPAGNIYTATYEAKVSPWSFWSEAGTITVTMSADDYERLLRGETIEMTGEARNGKGKLRRVSARAQPIDPTTGRIKIRIAARGTQLVFNSTYRITPASQTIPATAAPSTGTAAPR